MREKFKIKKISLGTKYLPMIMGSSIVSSSKINYDYLETSISYNNDYILGNKEYRKNIKNVKIISTIKSLKEYSNLLTYHLKYLNRKIIDILLLDVSGDWETNLKDLWENDEIYFNYLGISNVKSIDDIERFNKILDCYPAYCSIELSVFNFNKELIEYCQEKNIKIISFGCLGGIYNAESFIEMFSLQYLLGFASYYSDIVCISSKSIDEVIKSVKILNEYKNKSIKEDEIALFSLSKSIEKAIDNPKRKVINYYKITEGDFSVINSQSSYVPNEYLITSFKKNLGKHKDLQSSEIEMLIKSDLNLISIPEDMTDNNEIIAYYRYSIMSLIMIYYSEKYWKYNILEIGKSVYLVNLKRKFWIGKKDLNLIFSIDTYSLNSPIVFFKKLENTV